MSSKENIIRVTTDIREMLLKKNKAYGDSALDPIGIFNKGTATDSLCARIDDKLARIKNRGLNDDTEDTLFDLCGYLILLIIAKEKEELSTETRT
jgi:hypothetical protein